jgi:hypothetical protein
VVKKAAEYFLRVKYKDRTIEVQRLGNVKGHVTPVIRWATGTISKSLKQFLSNISGKHKIKELQKRRMGH